MLIITRPVIVGWPFHNRKHCEVVITVKIYYDLHHLSKNLPCRIEVAMTGKNEWNPSRWTPPADLKEAFEEGRSTRRLPDGSTAVLSWAPEMKDRWWSYDGAIDNQLTIGIDPVTESTRKSNGIMLVPDSEIKEPLSIATIMDPVGQSWSYDPIETGVLEMPADLVTSISWADQFTNTLVSHDGRIMFVDWILSSNFIMEIIDTDEQRKFYTDRLFKLLPKHLNHNKRELNKDHIVCDQDQLQNLKNWILTLPVWASIIIDSRLANACNQSLLIMSSSGMLVEDLINDPYLAIAVAYRCSRLSSLASGQIYDDDGDSQSFDQLALEYGPCWIMQVLLALDNNHPDNWGHYLDLTNDDDQWRNNADRDRVREACRLAGVMNAPIELWPRFYSILESRDPSRLDETEVLMLLATPIKNWAALEKAESITSDHGELARKACYLATSFIENLDSVYNLEDVQRAIVGSLSPDRPIAGQTVDLMMALDDVISGMYPTNRDLKATLNDIPRLLTDKPDMTGTINGASLIASDLNRMNVNEN